MKKTFIIAEVGINHNGSLLDAFRLIHAAKDAGADAVKFQKRDIESVYTKAELDKDRESPWGTTNRQQKYGLEFGKEEYDDIDCLCKEVGIEWFASPWDIKSCEFLKQYDLRLNKIASAMIVHRGLVENIAKQGKKTYISTGMSLMTEINDAVNIFRDHKCPFELMHCNSQYPMPDNIANLRMIKTLREAFGVDVGYSGHEVGIITSVAAVALGATSIERHLTLDRAMYGSDQSASIEPQGFKKLVDYIRVVENTLGDGVKRVTAGEAKCREKLRRTDDY